MIVKDNDAISRRGLGDMMVQKLEEAFNEGWLHNVLSRITPLTLRRRDDYMAMTDVFVGDADAANHLLDRFDADLELFCSVAGISVTSHMSVNTVSEELRAHVALYMDVATLLTKKFKIVQRNPIEMLVESPIMMEATNPFIKEFMDDRFNRN
jgi:hypothetical protein